MRKRFCEMKAFENAKQDSVEIIAARIERTKLSEKTSQNIVVATVCNTKGQPDPPPRIPSKAKHAKRSADSTRGKKHKSGKSAKNGINNKPPKIDYYRYLQSSAWSAKRKAAFSYHGRVCSICGSERSLHVHHRHYRTLGRERMRDLQILCRGCHANEHEGSVFGVVDPMTDEFMKLFR